MRWKIAGNKRDEKRHCSFQWEQRSSVLPLYTRPLTFFSLASCLCLCVYVCAAEGVCGGGGAATCGEPRETWAREGWPSRRRVSWRRVAQTPKPSASPLHRRRRELVGSGGGSETRRRSEGGEDKISSSIWHRMHVTGIQLRHMITEEDTHRAKVRPQITTPLFFVTYIFLHFCYLQQNPQCRCADSRGGQGWNAKPSPSGWTV